MFYSSHHTILAFPFNNIDTHFPTSSFKPFLQTIELQISHYLLQRQRENKLERICCSSIMSESNNISYVRCHSCTAVMGVNLLCESPFNLVTIKCGYCTSLLWVNAKASPLTLGQTSTSTSITKPLNKNLDNFSEVGNHGLISSDSDRKRESTTSTCKVPEKRQREPSAYNQFIKAEIQRIKTANPDISHKQAFSAASKNWALVPYMHFELSQDGNNQA